MSYKFALRDGNLAFYALAADGSSSQLISNTTILTNKFMHVAATLHGTTLTLYVNGVVVASDANFSVIRPDTAARVMVGASEWNPTGAEFDTFYGRIDELKLYSRALAVEELQAVYRAGIAGNCKPQRLWFSNDAYVKGATPGSNYGDAASLQVKRTLHPGSGKGRQAYLRFDTSAVKGEITRAVLRLNGRLSVVTPLNRNIPCAAFPVSDSTWMEGDLTWLNKPRPNVPNELARVIVTDDTPRWYDFDITTFINSERAAGRFVTGVLLRNMASGETGDFYTEFIAREADIRRPHLVITSP